MSKRLHRFSEKSIVLKKGKGIKKAILFSLIASMIFFPVESTNAASSIETEIKFDEELNERVYAEVLSGNITNDADVINVALAQYEERLNHNSRLLASAREQIVDDSLTITQILGSQMDEKGHVVEDVVTTNLLVLDQDSNIVKASSVQTGNAGLSEYSIYATMSVSVTNDTSVSGVRFNWFDTKLTYGTAMKAGSLTQASKYSSDMYFEHDDITKQISYPQANVAYRYTPANKDLISYLNYGGRSCRSIISAGSKSFILAYSFLGKACCPLGEWETAYN